MGTKEYIGITLDSELLKIARIQKDQGVWKLTQLDRIEIKGDKDKVSKKNLSKEVVNNGNDNFHFGIDDTYEDTTQSSEGFDLSMAVEDNGHSDSFNSNVVTLKDALEKINDKKLEIAITVQSGHTNFQVFKEKDFSRLKNKELQKFIEEHLQNVYGIIPDSDHYRYQVREGGSLLLASYQENPYLLQLLDSARLLSSNKFRIKQLLPDEVLLAALIKKNYDLKEDEITCVIHIGFKQSRIFFMHGDQIQHIFSPIKKGKASSNVLEIIFSKILFQLDTGEVSGLDRILITNNDMNTSSLSYFRKQFSDIHVDEFHFKADKIVVPEHLESVSSVFTSAIGSAIAAAESKDPDFERYSMLPSYVRERQKVLKLRWHGIVLLLMLLSTPLLWNHIYQEKQQQINDFNEELIRTEMNIMDLQNIAEKAGELENLHEAEKIKMDLLNSLSNGAYYWSETLKTLNDGLARIKHVWIDRLNHNDDGFMVQGYSTTRDRIPQVTNLFKWADLKAVSVIQMREIKVYKFTIQIYKDFTDDINSNFESKSGELNKKMGAKQ